MKKIIFICLMLFIISCDCRPIRRSECIKENYEGCEIIYQHNKSYDDNDLFVVIHQDKLKIITVKTTGESNPIVHSESIVHGIDIKVKNNKEIIKDINMILKKYADESN